MSHTGPATCLTTPVRPWHDEWVFDRTKYQKYVLVCNMGCSNNPSTVTLYIELATANTALDFPCYVGSSIRHQIRANTLARALGLTSSCDPPRLSLTHQGGCGLLSLVDSKLIWSISLNPRSPWCLWSSWKLRRLIFKVMLLSANTLLKIWFVLLMKDVTW